MSLGEPNRLRAVLGSDLALVRPHERAAADDELAADRTADPGQRVVVLANAAFHAHPIAVSGIEALAQAYDRVSVSDLMSRALTRDTRVSPHLAGDHVALADAYAAGDLAAVKTIIAAHTERAKTTQRAGIESAGGAV